MSRNPFLSTFEAEFNKEASKDLVDMSATMKDSPKKATFGTAAEELFVRVMPLFASCGDDTCIVTSHKLHTFRAAPNTMHSLGSEEARLAVHQLYRNSFANSSAFYRTT